MCPVGLSPLVEEALRKGSNLFYQTMDNEVSRDVPMDATVSELCTEFHRQGFKSTEKIAELTEETWQDKFAKFPTSLLACIKKADAAITSEPISDLLRRASCAGATEEQKDNALEEPDARHALITLIKSMQDVPDACVKEVVTASTDALEGLCVKEDAITPSGAIEKVCQKTILMIGGSGDGKSTIVNILKADAENEAPVSMAVKGTTKNVKEYRGRNNTIIVDTPGVGDYDVSVIQLYTLLEEVLTQRDRRIDYVVVTIPLNNVRFNLALQIVQVLVKKGFHKDDGHEWNHIIFCGTKKDRAEPEELESFQVLGDAFYEEAPNKGGSCVVVDQSDISELEKAVGTKPTKEIAFQAVGEKELAIALSAKLGFKDDDEFVTELRKERHKANKLQELPFMSGVQYRMRNSRS